MKTISIDNLSINLYIWNMSKDDAINILHNSNLIDKKGVL